MARRFPCRVSVTLLAGLMVGAGLIACPGGSSTAPPGSPDSFSSGPPSPSDVSSPPPAPQGEAWVGAYFDAAPAGAPGGAQVRIRGVARGSSAAEAGLRRGEWLLAANGRRVTGIDYLRGVLDARRPGDKLELEVMDEDGGRRSVKLDLRALDLGAVLNACLEAGARWLAERQDSKGSWRRTEGQEPEAPITSLAVRALAGLPADRRPGLADPTARGLAWLLALQSRGGAIVGDPLRIHFRNYTTALTLQSAALVSATDARQPEETYAKARQAMVDYLVTAQFGASEGSYSDFDFRHGGWNYHDPLDGAALPQTGPRPLGSAGMLPPGQGQGTLVRADISVASYVAEGLARGGLPADSPVWGRLRLYLHRTQNLSDPAASMDKQSLLDGGFAFSPREGKAGRTDFPDGDIVFRPYGSSTADGLRTLLRAGLTREDAPVRLAAEWLALHFTVTKNPNFSDTIRVPFDRGIYFYYLASLADALASYGQVPLTAGAETLDWPRDIVLRLAVLQGEDGAWRNQESVMNEDDPVIATAFALIALSHCDGAIGR